MTVEIQKVGDRVKTFTPYHPEFPGQAKKLGGRWDPGDKAWVFDGRDEDRVKELCREVYGTDGTAQEQVTLRVEFLETHEEPRGAIFLAGRQLARATGRDSGAKLGDGVVVLEGGFTSGGSVKNWETVARQGTVVELRDVPMVAAEKAQADSDKYIRVHIVDIGEFNRDALKAEGRKLLDRLREIEGLLGEKII